VVAVLLWNIALNMQPWKTFPHITTSEQLGQHVSLRWWGEVITATRGVFGTCSITTLAFGREIPTSVIVFFSRASQNIFLHCGWRERARTCKAASVVLPSSGRERRSTLLCQEVLHLLVFVDGMVAVFLRHIALEDAPRLRTTAWHVTSQEGCQVLDRYTIGELAAVRSTCFGTALPNFTHQPTSILYNESAETP
jgi:hypothetical protein